MRESVAGARLPQLAVRRRCCAKGTPIGLICVTRKEPGTFADQQIAAAADLRRPGGDRDRERAAVRRGAGAHRDLSGIAAAADRDRRRAQGHQPLGVRSAAGARYPGESAANSASASRGLQYLRTARRFAREAIAGPTVAEAEPRCSRRARSARAAARRRAMILSARRCRGHRRAGRSGSVQAGVIGAGDRIRASAALARRPAAARRRIGVIA